MKRREKLSFEVVTGERGKIFIEVLPREDVYHGPYISEPPDIILMPKRECPHILTELDNSNVVGTSEERAHFSDGIFIAHGEGIKEDYQIVEANIADLAPTVLHIVGESVPEDMEKST